MGKWGNIIEDMMAQMPEDLRTVALGVAEIFTNMDIETARNTFTPTSSIMKRAKALAAAPKGTWQPRNT